MLHICRRAAGLLAGALLLFALPARAEAPSLAVAVSDLRDHGVGPQISRRLTELLTLELSRVQGFDVVSYQDFRALLEHATKAQLSGCEDEECWIDLGKTLATEYLVHGAVARADGTLTVTVTLLDVSEARAIQRVSQPLRGDEESVLAALRTASTTLLAPLSETGAGRELEITPGMLAQLYTAQRPKFLDVDLRLGSGLLFATETQAALAPGALWSGRLALDYQLLRWLQLGVQLGVDYQRSETQGRLMVADYANGRLLLTPTRTQAELVASSGLLTAKLRPDRGLVMPYLSLQAGASYLWVNLGDVIPERKDLPAFLNQEREGSQGLALTLGAGAGVEVLLTDWLSLVVDLQLFDHLHGLRYRRYVAGQGQSETSLIDEDPVENLAGLLLTVGVGWQG